MHPSTSQQSSAQSAHISSPTQLITVFVLLLLLTALTVAAASWDTGAFDVWLALGIAGVKTLLVTAYFMHLRYDNPTHSLLVVFSIAVLVLFLVITLTDVEQLVPETEAAAEDAMTVFDRSSHHDHNVFGTTACV